MINGKIGIKLNYEIATIIYHIYYIHIPILIIDLKMLYDI